MSRIDRSVVAYAFLAQAQRSGNDLLSGLMPIFKPIAKQHEGQRFDPNKFSEIAAELYGLKVNAWAVESLAPRLESAGVLVRFNTSETTHEYLYAQIQEEYSAVTEKDISIVLEKFVKFCKPLLSEKKEQLFDEEFLKESFLQHIVDIDFVGALLKPLRPEEKTGRKTLRLKKEPDELAWEEDKFQRSRIDVLCASFIIDTFHKDRHLYEQITQITAGALVSEVVLNFQTPETEVSLNQLRVILDAPFLMDALDLASKDSHAVAASICNQLKENGATLAVFRHSIDEIKGNLSAVLGAYDSGKGFGPTARRLVDSTFRAYASAIKDSPEARLKQEGIQIIDPPLGKQAFQYFTGDDESNFCRSLGYYHNRLAQERDAASVAGTIRLRAGAKARAGKFQTCRSLFLTKNPWVAERSQKALINAGVYDEGDVPPAITDRYLAGLLWVIYGGKATELPSQVLLANCAAAIEPKTDLIQSMHRFLSKVDEKQADFFRALMTEERAAQYLSQITLGDSIYVTDENYPEILEYMKSSLIEKHENERHLEREKLETEKLKIEKEKENLRISLHKEIQDAQTETLQARSENKKLANKVETLQELIQNERFNAEERKNQIIAWSLKQATSRRRNLILSASIVIAILGISGAIAASQASNQYLQLIGTIVGGLVSILSFWKIPDFIFGRVIDRACLNTFRNHLLSRGFNESQISELSVSWNDENIQEHPTKPLGSE